MSHVTCSKAIITDIDCLEKAVSSIPGATFVRGRKHYTWYGSWENDWNGERAAYNRGIGVNQYGKCDHVIRIAGASYEVGVTKRNDGEGWQLVWDAYDGINRGGAAIAKTIGNDGQKLMSLYAEEICRKHAAETGMQMESTELEDGNLRVELIEI